MRVAYIFMRFPLPSETFASRDVQALRGQGFEVEAYALRAAHPEHEALVRERRLEGMRIVHGTPARVAKGLALAAKHPGVAADLLRWVVGRNGSRPVHLFNSCWFAPMALYIFEQLRRNPPDVVHLFWGHYPAMVGYLLKRHLPGVPLSAFLGAYDLAQGFGGTPDVLRQADVVWTHARANVPAIAALGELREDDVRVVPRGITLGPVDRALEREERQPRLVVTAGRLIPEKGMDDVLRAVASVRRAYPDARLVVLGDGPERARLERLAGRLGLGTAASFHGHVSEREVASMLARAEVFLLLSRKPSERLPNAVKEAMAAGCVAITTATPGIDELVDDGRSGYVVPLADPEAAADRIHRVFEAADGLETMRRNARQTVEDRFEVHACMARYAQRWRQLTRGEQ